MYNKPIYLTSDVHLGALNDDGESSFHKWMNWASANAAQIIINGDLFDFWFEFRTGIPSGYQKSLSVLKAVIQSGVPVTLVGGNHDWWAGRYLQEEVGISFEPDPLLLNLAGYKVFMAHGDGLGPGNNTYRLVRYFLRSRVLTNLFSLLDPSWGSWIGAKVSRTKQKRLQVSSQEQHQSEALKTWALNKLKEEPNCDLIFLGHTHIPWIERMGNNRYYINTGDWVYNRTFAILNQGEQPSLCCWKSGRSFPYLPK
ncbi:MAG: UDP-2,3-diacylglucosamine diphosphatase [Longimicrobiales bacterium]